VTESTTGVEPGDLRELPLVRTAGLDARLDQPAAPPDREDVTNDHSDETQVRGYMHSAETTGTVNGPGVRYTIYLSGCPLRCLYCHNPDTWEMRLGARTTVQAVIDDIAPYQVFARTTGGGITASGGEPLLQPRFLTALFRQAKVQLGGMHTALDTSGSLGARAGDDLLDVTDLVLLDIKSGLPETYRRVTAGELAPTLTFAQRLSDRGNRMWIRYVLVPGLTDAPDNVGEVARFAATLSTVDRVEILPFHSLGQQKYDALGRQFPLYGTRAPTPDEVRAAKQIFAAEGLPVR
jgi:pyruvate formate lyase activating enzyme